MQFKKQNGQKGDLAVVGVQGNGTIWDSVQRVVVPAVDEAYTERSLSIAARIAGLRKCNIVLASIIVVPRALALDDIMPIEEENATIRFRSALEILSQFGAKAISTVVRAREAVEGVDRLVNRTQNDLVILGVSQTQRAGLPHELCIDLLNSLGCDVLLNCTPGYSVTGSLEVEQDRQDHRAPL